MVRVADHLYNRHELAPGCSASLEHGMVKANLVAENEQSAKLFFATKMAKVKQLLVTWLSPFLSKAVGEANPVSAAILDKVHSVNPDSLLNLFVFAIGVIPNTPLPAAFAHKTTCSKGCMKRYNQMGRRLEHLADFIDTKTGVIDWNNFGAYILSFHAETGSLQEIRHISGAVAAPPTWMPIARDFTLIGHWLDDGARLQRSNLADIPILQMFPSDSDFKLLLVDKNARALEELAAAAQGEIEEQQRKQDAEVAIQNDNCLPTTKKDTTEKRKATLSRARKVLSEKRRQRRTVDLSGSLPMLTDGDA